MKKGYDTDEDPNGNYDDPCQGSVTRMLADSRPETPSKKIPFTRPSTPKLNASPHDNFELDCNDPGDKLCCPILPSAQFQNSKPTRSLLFQQLRDCHLKSMLNIAQRCLQQLTSVKTSLSALALRLDPSQAQSVFRLAGVLTTLSRQAFTPAHQMFTAALDLHFTEDLIRNPSDSKLEELSKGSRPPRTWILQTQMKLRDCVDSAAEVLHRFDTSAAEDPMQEMLLLVMHAFQDLYATGLACGKTFPVLLPPDDFGGKVLREFIQALEPVERSDFLVQVQTLRRTLDDIVIKLERLSWASCAVERLARDRMHRGSRSSSKSHRRMFKDDDQEEDVEEPEEEALVRRGRSRSRKKRVEAQEADCEDSTSCRPSSRHSSRSKARPPEGEESSCKRKSSKSRSKSVSKADVSEEKEHRTCRRESRSPCRSYNTDEPDLEEGLDWQDEGSKHRKSKKAPDGGEEDKRSILSFKSLSSGGGKSSSSKSSHKNKSAKRKK